MTFAEFKDSDVYIDVPTFEKLDQNPGANTKINYLYRDASNYYTFGEAIFPGAIGIEGIRTIFANRDEDGGFIPGQVAMADLQLQLGNFDEDDDHPFHEFNTIGLTLADPTETIGIDELIRLFSEVSWDQEYRPA